MAEPAAPQPDSQVEPSASRAATTPPATIATGPGTAAGMPSLEQDPYVVGPGEREAVITVRRIGGTEGELAVEWAASNGGAKPGQDFIAPARGRLVLAAGQDSAQLVIPVLRNAERRYTEYFEVQLLRGMDAGAQRHATVFILPGAGGAPAKPVRRAGG